MTHARPLYPPAGNRTVYLVRHGETAWSLTGQHTGRTDLALTSRGEDQARRLMPSLRPMAHLAVLASPMQRARRTAALAMPQASAEVEADLAEWDYGAYEGLRSVEIRTQRPDWNIFRDGCPGGETPAQISTRADMLIDRLRQRGADCVLFSHGHFGCVLAARWIGLPVSQARHFRLDTASVSILGEATNEPGVAVIRLWNAVPEGP